MMHIAIQFDIYLDPWLLPRDWGIPIQGSGRVHHQCAQQWGSQVSFTSNGSRSFWQIYLSGTPRHRRQLQGWDRVSRVELRGRYTLDTLLKTSIPTYAFAVKKKRSPVIQSIILAVELISATAAVRTSLLSRRRRRVIIIKSSHCRHCRWSYLKKSPACCKKAYKPLMLNSAQPFDCQVLKNGKQISSWHICSTLYVIQDSKCTIYVIVFLVFVMDFVLV